MACVGSPNPEQVQLRSQPSRVHALVRFHNRTMYRADVIWFNYEGQGVRYKTLMPSQSVDVNTFVGHPWIFRDHDTGDRLVVCQEDVFTPDTDIPEDRWQVRRNINITTPVRSLYDTCLRELRNLTFNIPIPRLIGLQESIPNHVVHELIRNHKVAAIYRRMARGHYSNSTEELANHEEVNIGVGEIENNSNHVHTNEAENQNIEVGQETGAGEGNNSSCTSEDKSHPRSQNNGAGDGSQQAEAAPSGASNMHVFAESSHFVNNHRQSQSTRNLVGLNKRRLSPASLQARCTAALMTPCTVTTRTLNSSASSSPRLSPTISVGPGLLRTCTVTNTTCNASGVADDASSTSSCDYAEVSSFGLQNVNLCGEDGAAHHCAGDDEMPSGSQGDCSSLVCLNPDWSSTDNGDTEVDTEDESVNNNNIEAKCLELGDREMDDHLNEQGPHD